jgi:hypothetical protein
MKPSLFVLSVSIALFSCLTAPAFAQTADLARFEKRNSIQLNSVIGAGLLGLGYERLLYQSGRHKVFAGLYTGVSTTVESSEPFPFRRGWHFGGTVGVDYSRALGQKNKHHLDLGLSYAVNRAQLMGGSRSSSWSSVGGYGPVREDVYWSISVNHFLMPRVGYRFQKPGGGFTWRGGVIPFSFALAQRHPQFSRRFDWLPFPYATVGWSF